jgi:hypothetical protein
MLAAKPVLRRQLTGRLRWDHVDRLWLAALSRLVTLPLPKTSSAQLTPHADTHGALL